MIQSMTGYGRCEVEHPLGTICVELKAVNSKTLDLSSMRLPMRYKQHEAEIRTMLIDTIGRGKIDLSISATWHNGTPPTATIFNEELIKTLAVQIRDSIQSINFQATDPAILQALLARSECWSQKEEEVSAEEQKALRTAMRKALKELLAFRKKEGKATEKDLLRNLKVIEEKSKKIDACKDERIEATEQKIQDGLARIQSLDSREIDQARYAQEILYYIERLDINEELKRLEQHCSYFRETIQKEEAQGRKLAFISQEMGREINTLGSKANSVKIQRLVVEMKEALEKIKEQMLNIL